MAFSFNKTKRISKRTKYKVSGFIHDHQQSLSKQSKFYNVPLLIHHLCLCYYYVMDEWNTEFRIGDSEDGIDAFKIEKYILKRSGSSSYVNWSVYLTNIIKSGVYSWKFKIHSFLPNHAFYLFDIGVWKINSDKRIINDAFNETPNTSYSF